MFSKLRNEAIIEFDMHTESPLFIKSSDEDQLNPASAEHTFFVTYRNGKLVPTIPGSTMKGVFRSTAELLLEDMDVCNLFSKNKSCSGRINKEEKEGKGEIDNIEKESLGKSRYKGSCPVCKLFGSQVLKSRITFCDAYPVGDYKTGRRASVAIDRITGASKKGALFDFEYIEDAVFRCKVYLRNFFRWHIKLLFEIFNRIDEGYTTFGGFSSKGLGRMKVSNESITVRYYENGKKVEGYSENEFYIEKKIAGRDNILKYLDNVSLKDKSILEGCEIQDDQTL